MSFPVWFEIVCGECSTTLNGGFTYWEIPRRALKKLALEENWAFVGDEIYCPRCKTGPILNELMRRNKS